MRLQKKFKYGFRINLFPGKLQENGYYDLQQKSFIEIPFGIDWKHTPID